MVERSLLISSGGVIDTDYCRLLDIEQATHAKHSSGLREKEKERLVFLEKLHCWLKVERSLLTGFVAE